MMRDRLRPTVILTSVIVAGIAVGVVIGTWIWKP